MLQHDERVIVPHVFLPPERLCPFGMQRALPREGEAVADERRVVVVQSDSRRLRCSRGERLPDSEGEQQQRHACDAEGRRRKRGRQGGREEKREREAGRERRKEREVKKEKGGRERERIQVTL